MKLVFTNHAKHRIADRFPDWGLEELYLSMKKRPTKYQKRYMRKYYPSAWNNGKQAKGGYKYARMNSSNICMILVSRPGRTVVVTAFRLPSSKECKQCS
jgi:hypothetical protein